MYKLHLILKYLLKRRIAWVSLVAVMLCTTMVLVVISVMGGWLLMFKSSFRGLSGDIVIHSETLKGFPYYQEMIDAIQKDPACKVESAVPSIETAGLFNHGNGPIPVRVMGLQVEHIDDVNKFGQSLYLQRTVIVDKLKDKNLPASERADLEHKLNQLPSLALLDELSTPMNELPPGLVLATPAEGQTLPPGTIAMPEAFGAELKGRLRYDALRKNLVFRGAIKDQWKPLLASLSPDPGYHEALDKLATQTPFADYPTVAGRYNGLIVGTGVIGIQRDINGDWQRPGQIEWETPTHLTVLDLSGNAVNGSSEVTRNFFIVDDSHIGAWQYDSNYVYVGFDVLQRDLGLDAQPVTIDGQNVIQPARVTDIHVKVKPSVNPNDERQLIALRQKIEATVRGVLVDQEQKHPYMPIEMRPPLVETWQDTLRVYISAIENEKLIMVILFGIMCIVAIFLIFCIFYMIVVEKTRDIGIIKSVGATSAGVAGIFLGYGLVIGIIGAGMGLLLSYLIVHNINAMHAWLGRVTGVLIWNPQVYQFDKIPDRIDPTDILWIVPIAILASVLGALIPALRAASMNPVESLRWE